MKIEEFINGNFIKKRWAKCPHLIKKCKWLMNDTHREGYEYLDNTCYLSGSSKLQCPK